MTKTLALLMSVSLLFPFISWADNAMPPVRTSSVGIKYVVGGVGTDERKAMRSAYSSFKLHIEQAEKGGAYSAGMHLRIYDSQNQELLETTMEGPWLLVDLPSGVYTLAAIRNGREFRKQISLGNEAQQQVVFIWPKPE